MRDVTCPACLTSDASELPVRSARWSVVECRECGHAFARDRGGAEPARNVHFEADAYVRWRAETARRLAAQARSRADAILRRTALEPGRVLELGCSTGEMLHELASRGWEAHGVDLSAQAIELARRSYPEIHVSVGTEDDVAGGAGPREFEMILAFHVLEHIPDLDRALERWQRFCVPGGRLVIFVPNWGSWSRAVLGDAWPDYMPEHLHFFARRSLSRLLERHSFSVVHVATGGTSWQWLGGLRRKLGGRAGAGSEASGAGRAMPGSLAMRALQLGDLALLPLLLCERAFGGGSELQVIATRNVAPAG